MRYRLRTLLIVLALGPVVAWLAVVTMYLAEEVRYNAAEKERVMRARNESVQKASPDEN